MTYQALDTQALITRLTQLIAAVERDQRALRDLIPDTDKAGEPNPVLAQRLQSIAERKGELKDAYFALGADLFDTPYDRRMREILALK